MKAVDIKDGKGPASSLFVNSDIPKPQPKPTECLIRVKAFGLNRADTMQRNGKYVFYYGTSASSLVTSTNMIQSFSYPVPPGVTQIMGVEFAGIIETVGHGTEENERHNWKEGEEVFGLAYGGAYAEYVVVSKKMLIRKPKELSWEVCGGVCETWFTALQALYLVGEFDPKTTKSILWHAGASGVSIAGQQLSLHAASPSPNVFATARKDAKCDFCVKTLGSKAAVNTTSTEDWASALKEANDGNGMDLVIDFVAAPYFQQNLDVLAMDGKVVMLGVMGGTKLGEGVDIGAILRKRARYQGSTLRSRDAEYQGKLRDLFEEKVLPELVSGKFKNPIEKVLPMEKIREAHGESPARERCFIERAKRANLFSRRIDGVEFDFGQDHLPC